MDLHEKVLSVSRRFNQRVAIDLAKIEIAKKQAKMMERYAAQAKELGIQVGSQVYVKMEKKEPSKKLRKPYEGPFQVLEIMERGNVRLKDMNQPLKPPIVWHVTKLKPTRHTQRLAERRYHVPVNERIDPKIVALAYEEMHVPRPVEQILLPLKVETDAARQDPKVSNFWIVPEDDMLQHQDDKVAWREYEVCCMSSPYVEVDRRTASVEMPPPVQMATSAAEDAQVTHTPTPMEWTGARHTAIMTSRVTVSTSRLTAPRSAPVRYSLASHRWRGDGKRRRFPNRVWVRPGHDCHPSMGQGCGGDMAI